MREFEAAVRESALILTDGGIETRVMFETDIQLPPYVQVAALVTDPEGGPALRRIYESYVEAARSAGLPDHRHPDLPGKPQLCPPGEAR
jgi:homocysteine S-methyltransferase